MINKVFISGRVTKEPVYNIMPDKKSVINFTLANITHYKKNEEIREEVAFVGVVVFGKMAEKLSSELKRGSHVIVMGRLRFEQWTSKDGTKRDRIVVVASEIMQAEHFHSKITEEQKKVVEPYNPTPLYDDEH